MDIRSRRRAGMSTWEDDAAGQVQSACAAAGFRRNRRCGRAAPRPRPRHRCRRQGAAAFRGKPASRPAGRGSARCRAPAGGRRAPGRRSGSQRRRDAVERFGGKHGGGRRGRVEYRAGVAQQAVEVVLAERLAGQLGDPQVMGHHVVAQTGADRLAVGIGHHAAAMQAYVQTRHLAGGGEQRRGAVAPAAERIVEVMQGEVVHLGLHETPRRGRLDQRLSAGAAQGHCISPLSTLALSSRPSSPGRFG